MDGELEEALKKHFRHSKFKSSLQKSAIKTILQNKKDVFISMPTGSGKSLCFQLPGVIQENKLVWIIIIDKKIT
jgi:ATP-dependent DNA helicase Q5